MFSGFDFPDVEAWIAVAAGLVVAYIVYRTMGGGRRRLVPPLTLETAAPVRLSPSTELRRKIERRRFPRRSGNHVAVLLSDDAKRQHSQKGVVLDRSQGGLRLLVDRELEVGTKIDVIAHAAAPLTPWTPIEVLRCQLTAGRWECGCQFVRAVPFNVMWQFG